MAAPDPSSAAEYRQVRSPSIDVLHCTEGLVFADVGRLCVGIWREKSTRERVLIQKQILRQVVSRYQDGAGYLMIVEPSSDPPDDDVRRESAAMVTELGEKLRCVACVMEGTGFRAAVLRTVLSGIIFLIRSRTPIKVFDTVTAASVWLSRQLPLPSAGDLVERVGMLRSFLDYRPQSFSHSSGNTTRSGEFVRQR